MNAWYDIYSLQENSPEDEAGITLATQSVENLISTEFSNYLSDKIIIAGFSQGGAVALHCYLHGSVEIAGVMALSTYLPLQDKLACQPLLWQAKIFLWPMANWMKFYRLIMPRAQEM